MTKSEFLAHFRAVRCEHICALDDCGKAVLTVIGNYANTLEDMEELTVLMDTVDHLLETATVPEGVSPGTHLSATIEALIKVCPREAWGHFPSVDILSELKLTHDEYHSQTLLKGLGEDLVVEAEVTAAFRDLATVLGIHAEDADAALHSVAKKFGIAFEGM